MVVHCCYITVSSWKYIKTQQFECPSLFRNADDLNVKCKVNLSIQKYSKINENISNGIGVRRGSQWPDDVWMGSQL